MIDQNRAGGGEEIELFVFKCNQFMEIILSRRCAHALNSGVEECVESRVKSMRWTPDSVSTVVNMDLAADYVNQLRKYVLCIDVKKVRRVLDDLGLGETRQQLLKVKTKSSIGRQLSLLMTTTMLLYLCCWVIIAVAG